MALLVSLFALSGSVWMIPILRQGRLTSMVAILLVLGTVFGPFFFAIDGPIQISLDRVFWGLCFVYAAVMWRVGKLTLPKLHRIDWMVILTTVYLLVSSTQGDDPPGNASPFARWLFYIFMPGGTYWLMRMASLRSNDVFRFHLIWIGLGIYLATTALFEIVSLHALVFPRYISDPTSWEFFGRGRGPLLNPIANGVIMGGALVASVLAAFRGNRFQRAFFAASSLLLLLGVYATLTRSCWVGAVGAVGFIGMLYAPRWMRIWSLALLVLLAGAMAMGLKDQLLAMKRDKALSAAEAAKSVELRPLLAVVAWEMHKDKPIFGHGFGHYFAYNDPYHNDRSYGLPLETVRTYMQHNTFLSVLVDGGLVGLLLLCGSLWLLGTNALSLVYRTTDTEIRDTALVMLGMLVIYISNALFHDLIVIPMVQMFLMATAGVFVSALTRGVEDEASNAAPVGSPVLHAS